MSHVTRTSTIALAALFVLPAILVTPAGAQQEQGDMELQFAGVLFGTVGQDDISVTQGVFQAKVGYQVTDRVQVGGFPSLLIQRTRVGTGQVAQTDTDTKLGMGVFAVYSFLAEDAVTVPYLGGQAYRIDVTDQDETGWVGVTGGFKFYLSPRTAFDAGANYLIGLGDSGGALVLVQVGLSLFL
jgi:hypothetical protein